MWPVYVSLANLPGDTRNIKAGKRIIAYITIPKRGEYESEAKYQYAFRVLYHTWWSNILDITNMWVGGVWLKMPGWSRARLVKPKIGLLLGDMVELWLMTAISSHASICCITRHYAEDDEEKTEEPARPSNLATSLRLEDDEPEPAAARAVKQRSTAPTASPAPTASSSSSSSTPAVVCCAVHNAVLSSVENVVFCRPSVCGAKPLQERSYVPDGHITKLQSRENLVKLAMRLLLQACSPSSCRRSSGKSLKG